jgi:hypothetical protein
MLKGKMSHLEICKNLLFFLDNLQNVEKHTMQNIEYFQFKNKQIIPSWVNTEFLIELQLLYIKEPEVVIVFTDLITEDVHNGESNSYLE